MNEHRIILEQLKGIKLALAQLEHEMEAGVRRREMLLAMQTAYEGWLRMQSGCPFSRMLRIKGPFPIEPPPSDLFGVDPDQATC
ncbi:MAG: hypothetical protein HYY09_05040 [Firmicutes bacterium]|nr:hypothetical protein [Bacillota bacterium]